MAKIKLEPVKIQWEIGSTWKKNIEPQILEQYPKYCEDDIHRTTYVIRANGGFLIDYHGKFSPVLYIGEGGFSQRIAQHKNWLGDLADTVAEFPFEIFLFFPRVKNYYEAYKCVEADFLAAFKQKYGMLPLKNQQSEYVYADRNEYEPKPETFFGVGQGSKQYK